MGYTRLVGFLNLSERFASVFNMLPAITSGIISTTIPHVMHIWSTYMYHHARENLAFC